MQADPTHTNVGGVTVTAETATVTTNTDCHCHCHFEFDPDGCLEVERQLEISQQTIRGLGQALQHSLTQFQELLAVVRRCPPIWFRGRDDNGDGLVQLDEFAAVQRMIDQNWKGQQ